MNKKLSVYILILSIYFSYFFGFFYNENSIGSGGYGGDLEWMWENFEIFKNNSLLDAINHKDFFGNRTPLIYIINILFNPFIYNIDYYRFSIFIISLITPLIFYKCLIIKFGRSQKLLIFLISLIVLLSPYFRTTAYWGMEINYSIISLLATYYYYLKIKKKKQFKLVDISKLIFFSSICIYFDQKFLFLPIMVFLTIMFGRAKILIKLFCIVFFFILSLPYMYLIYQWKGIVPPLTQVINQSTITNLSRIKMLHFEHIGYSLSIIAMYILPIFFLYKNPLNYELRNFLKKKLNYVLMLLFLIYLYYFSSYLGFEFITIEKYSYYNFGLGITHKLSILLSDNILMREILTYISFFISFVIVLIFVKKNYNDVFIIIFFILVSLLVFPIMQEYFDLVITMSAMLIFKNKIIISYKGTLLFVSYFIIYLLGCIIYYHKILQI